MRPQALDAVLTTVKSAGTNTDKLCVLKKIIMCTSAWHCPVSLQKFKSAIHALHDAYDNLRDKYHPVCLDC